MRSKVKGDSRRIVTCGEVEELFFNRTRLEVTRRRKKRGAAISDDRQRDSIERDSMLGNSIGQVAKHKAPAYDFYASDEDDEVGGVPIYLPEDIAARKLEKFTPEVTSPADCGEINQEEADKRLAGQVRAEERELVRRVARRGCVFGFVLGRGEGADEGGSTKVIDEGNSLRRKCEAVQGGRTVEASFAKGEWGIRWRE